MSPRGQKKYWSDADDRYSEFDCKSCEDNRDYLLKYSPIIRFMNDNIKKLGGEEMGNRNIHCRTCKAPDDGDENAEVPVDARGRYVPKGMQAGFDHQYGIKICANWVQDRSTLEDVLAHEMVHAYDHLRFKTKLSDEDGLRHAACTEVCKPDLRRWCANRVYRFEHPTYLASAAGPTSSSTTVSSALRTTIRIVYDAGRSDQSWVDHSVRMMFRL
jgi:mitochondrial inner membrane protease ATP23